MYGTTNKIESVQIYKNFAGDKIKFDRKLNCFQKISTFISPKANYVVFFIFLFYYIFRFRIFRIPN